MHWLMVPRLVDSIVAGRKNAHDTAKIADDILAHAPDVDTLTKLISDLAKQMG